MGERGPEIELGERGIGDVETGAEHPALVAAAHVEGPGGVGLVLQYLSADEPECLLERSAGPVGRLAARAFEQLVEAVEVERDELGRESVCLVLRNDQLTCSRSVGRQMPAQGRDERLEGARDVLRPLRPPDRFRESVDRHAVPPSREQDLRAPASGGLPRGRPGRACARRRRSRAARTGGSPAAPHRRSII